MHAPEGCKLISMGSFTFGKRRASDAKLGALMELDGRVLMIHHLGCRGARCTCSARTNFCTLSHFRSPARQRKDAGEPILTGYMHTTLCCYGLGSQLQRSAVCTRQGDFIMLRRDPPLSENIELAKRKSLHRCSSTGVYRWCITQGAGAYPRTCSARDSISPPQSPPPPPQPLPSKHAR